MVDNSAERVWVTTVIPTFERADLLRRAVLSVLTQTYPWARVTVFDNGSQDATDRVLEELATRFPGRVEYQKNPENVGSLLNFDRAIRSVETPFFSIMSDDDVLLPTFFEAALDQLKQHPNADIACGRTWAIDPNGRVLNFDPATFPNAMFEAPKGAEFMLLNRHPDWQGMLFRREVLDTCHGLNPEVAGFDVDFVVRAAALHGIVFFEESVALFLRHQSAATFDLKLQYIYPSYMKMLESIEREPQIPTPFKAFARREVPKLMERALRPYIVRESVSETPRDLELAIHGLIESNDSPQTRRIALVARLLQRSVAAKKVARAVLGLRRRRTKAKVAARVCDLDFSGYLATKAL